MKILFLGNNWTAWKILSLLKESGEEIVGLVMHPTDRRKFSDEIINASGLTEDRIFDASKLKEKETLSRIKFLAPDIGLSIYLGYILKSELLDIFLQGCLNLHPSLLPYNRGSYPNVWSIVEGTPAGATLHYVDAGIDTGDIIAQKEIITEPVDTGESLYRKLELACVELFRDNWTKFKSGELKRIPQIQEAGTYHRIKDVEALDEINLERNYKARDLIDILRARTFPPFRGAFFREGERRIYLELKLEEDRK